VRIIAGKAKGRKLAAPRSGTRPFTGRAREAVFSVLGSRVAGAAVLDLFAGSGSLGLEALSRGARSVLFVEQDRAAIRILEQNLAAVGLGGTTVRSDVGPFLTRDRGTYDLVFIDPPFAMEDPVVDRIVALVDDHVPAGGIVVVHRRAGGSPPKSDNLQSAEPRRYGDSEIWILEKEQR